MNFKYIFNNLTLPNGVMLKNRIIMGAMHTGLESEKNFERLAEFYKARAQGGVGTIITGGFSPNFSGRLSLGSAKLTNYKEAYKHQKMVEQLHNLGSRVILQILHAGRYGYHPFVVAPSRVKAAISPFAPWKMTNFMIKSTIKHFVRAAKLAHFAGYDGVEIMGSEGYLINQFLVARTNKRRDQWGGSYKNRMKFPLAIISGIRRELPKNFIIIFRISLLDLVSEGSNWQEVIELAKALEKEGVDILSSGFGWHEASIPTIAGIVPNAAFADVVKKLKSETSIPIILSNRINMPEQAEKLISENYADLISMARPFLSDPMWVEKAYHNNVNLINTCIACNQGCLDEVFQGKNATCMVNPQAGNETELVIEQTKNPKKLAVIGAGPAGMAFARIAAIRGHLVTLFEKEGFLGGQFNLAKIIPGKSEYAETIRYFTQELQSLAVPILYNTLPTVAELKNFEEVVCATGVQPRKPNIAGIDLPHVVSYSQLLKRQRPNGKNIVILGAGGVGIDVTLWLLNKNVESASTYMQEWGIDYLLTSAGGLKSPNLVKADNQITILQRQQGKIGAKLGKTTAWIHRKYLKNHGVSAYSGVEYLDIDNTGINIRINNQCRHINADLIVYCTGNTPDQKLFMDLKQNNIKAHLIGGAYESKNLDAKFAFNNATRLALLI